jgi:hypothetical protein
MGFSGLFMLGYIVTLPMLIAQWVGILGLRHAGRAGHWWTMAAGVACSTVGVIASVAGLFFMNSFSSGSGGPGFSSILLIAGSGLPALGSILFGIGFALHGLRAARIANRVQELEQLTSAMSEEITQLREKASQAP